MTERRISQMAPLEAAIRPEVTPRAQYTGFPGMLTMRAVVNNRERGRWSLSVDTAAPIADWLESTGHPSAPEFRAAWQRASLLPVNETPASAT